MNFLTQVQEVASNLRLDSTVAAQKTLIQRWLNMAGMEIHAEANWNWSIDRQVVQTVNDITAGTVSINASAVTATGSGTAWGSSQVGSYIQFSSTNDWYKITAVASTTSLTIEAAYVGSTNLSAGTYIIRKFFYSLGSTTEKILTARQTISPSFLGVMNFRDADVFRPNATSTGNPLTMVLYGVDSSGNLQMTLWPWPAQVQNVEVRFKKLYSNLVNDTDVSPIPEKFHATVMIDGALYRGFQYLSTDNPNYLARIQQTYQRFKLGLLNMKAQVDEDQSYHLVIDNRDVPSVPFGPVLPFKYGIGDQ